MNRSQIRARAEAMIEQLIAILDQIDGDCDLECNGDFEPSLASPGRYRRGGMEYDLEGDHCDAEPFLGWSEHQSERGKPPIGDEFHPDSGPLHFRGKGYLEGNALLRRHKLRPVRLMAGCGL